MIDTISFLNDLNEFISEQEKEMLGISEAEEHLINDKNQANYFIKLSKQCDQDIEEIKTLVETERDRLNHLLDKYMEHEISIINRQKEYYDRALEDYIHRELDGSNKRSIKLPYGTIAIKKQQPQYNYVDDTIIEWAKDSYPDLIKTTIPEPKVTINKTDLKKMGSVIGNILYIDGKEVPGVEITLREDKFEIK